MNHREALLEIAKICGESSEMSRRTQKCLDVALTALGYTQSQRAERHTKALMRSEVYKETRNSQGQAKARKELEDAVLGDTGEHRERVRNKVSEEYV